MNIYLYYSKFNRYLYFTISYQNHFKIIDFSSLSKEGIKKYLFHLIVGPHLRLLSEHSHKISSTLTTHIE